MALAHVGGGTICGATLTPVSNLYEIASTVLSANAAIVPLPYLPKSFISTALAADSSISAVANFNLVLKQTDFRWRTDTNPVDATPTWAVAEDVSAGFQPGYNTFRLRVAVVNTSSADFSGPYELYVSKNAGAQSLITTTSTGGVQSADASSDADETPIYIPRLSITLLDPATVTWINAVIANGGSVSAARRLIVDNLIVGLRADGLFTKIDRLWLLAAENSQSARTDLFAATLASVVGSPTFSTDRGYTGSDLATATNYLNSNFNPVSSGVNVTLNSAHISAWSVTNNAVVNGGVLTGHNNGSTAGLAVYDPEPSSQKIAGRVNDLTGGTGSAPGTFIGHWLANRSDSTHTQIYQNGSLFTSPNATSVALSNFNVYMLAQNGAGTAFGGSPQQVAMVSLGGNLNSTDASNFYNRMRTYMTAVGVP